MYLCIPSRKQLDTYALEILMLRSYSNSLSKTLLFQTFPPCSNFPNQTHRMSLKEWNAVNQVMDAFCGSEFADHRYGGKVVLKEWQRQYGRTKKGGSICGKARPGPEICPDRNELCRHR